MYWGSLGVKVAQPDPFLHQSAHFGAVENTNTTNTRFTLRRGNVWPPSLRSQHMSEAAEAGHEHDVPTVNGFAILEKLGAGAFATVHLCKRVAEQEQDPGQKVSEAEEEKLYVSPARPLGGRTH